MVKDSSITSCDKAWSFRVKSVHLALGTGHWTTGPVCFKITNCFEEN